jgi:hypothetical protein
MESAEARAVIRRRAWVGGWSGFGFADGGIWIRIKSSTTRSVKAPLLATEVTVVVATADVVIFSRAWRGAELVPSHPETDDPEVGWQ